MPFEATKHEIRMNNESSASDVTYVQYPHHQHSKYVTHRNLAIDFSNNIHLRNEHRNLAIVFNNIFAYEI